MRRLARKDIPAVTASLLKHQAYTCPLCGGALRQRSKKTPALDHDHSTGFIRGVLCVNCNGIEGKINNLVRRAKGVLDKGAYLERLVLYWDHHSTPQYGGVLHHTHKTPEEKRLARNAKARKLRAKRNGPKRAG